ncbi:MAG: hypothetical protein V4670_09660 [Bacteroidota bacterium]
MKLQNLSKILVFLYFINLFSYSFISLLGFKNYETGFWFFRIPILMVLYYISSKQRKPIYFLGLLLYQTASLLFGTQEPSLFLFGTISSVLFKFCLVILIVDLIKIQNKLAITIAAIPFFVIYLYIIDFVGFSLGDSYYIWVVNAFLTSFLGGVAIINHINNSDQKGFWLLVSAILFVVQIGAFFVNKFYLGSEAIYQMVILAYGVSHFTFYKFMILKEMEDYAIKKS